MTDEIKDDKSEKAPENTEYRDVNYGRDGNLEYYKAYSSASIAINIKKGRGDDKHELADLRDDLVDDIINPKILGVFDTPRWMINPVLQAATLEGTEDAFLSAGIPAKQPEKGQNSR